MRSYLSRSFNFAAIVFLLAGCSSMKFLSRVEEENIPEPEIHRRDFRGAIHVHSKYPDDRNAVSRLGEIADRVGLDFVVVTDHNCLSVLKDGKEGYYGRTLLIGGDEISTDSGHLLAWGMSKETETLDPRKAIEEIRDEEGVVFLAHPFAKDHGWKDWSLTGYTGIEIYNIQANVLEEDFVSLGVRGIVLSPDDFFKSTVKISPETIAKWDLLLSAGKVVGVGSTDAHERYGLPGFEIDSYDVMLKTVNCHIFVPKLDRKSIVRAFREGTLYTSFDIFGNPRGFDFYLQQEKGKILMGWSSKLGGKDFLVIKVNRKAQVRLVHNGKVVMTAEGDHFEVPVAARGFYRVEVYLNGRPWIFSNPVYVR